MVPDTLASSIAQALPQTCQPQAFHPTQWFLLYNSDIHGKSFNRLVQRVEQKGPTVIVIKVKDEDVFIGAFCESDWLSVAQRERQSKSQAAAKQRAAREGQSTSGLAARPDNQSNVFFGNENCFIFSASTSGETSIYRSRSSVNSNFMYLFDTHPLAEKQGIGMGGQAGYFGWFMDRWLEKGACNGARCTTFQNPRLTPSESWTVEAVEVYAVSPPVVESLLALGDAGTADNSVLQSNPDREADKMLLELHGVHKFDQNERTEC